MQATLIKSATRAHRNHSNSTFVLPELSLCCLETATPGEVPKSHSENLDTFLNYLIILLMFISCFKKSSCSAELTFGGSVNILEKYASTVFLDVLSVSTFIDSSWGHSEVFRRTCKEDRNLCLWNKSLKSAHDGRRPDVSLLKKSPWLATRTRLSLKCCVLSVKEWTAAGEQQQKQNRIWI